MAKRKGSIAEINPGGMFIKGCIKRKNNCGKYPRPTANFTVRMQSSKQLSSEKYQSTLEECDRMQEAEMGSFGKRREH